MSSVHAGIYVYIRYIHVCRPVCFRHACGRSIYSSSVESAIDRRSYPYLYCITWGVFVWYQVGESHAWVHIIFLPLETAVDCGVRRCRRGRSHRHPRRRHRPPHPTSYRTLPMFYPLLHNTYLTHALLQQHASTKRIQPRMPTSIGRK